jgi:hypothetical protein
MSGAQNFNNTVVDVDAGLCPNGVFTINNLVASGRWTLHVKHGDLNVTGGSVSYGGPASLLNSASFGVVVDGLSGQGNIYINNTVTDLSGYYYATGRANTCAQEIGPGVVKSLGNGASDYSVASCRTVLRVHGLLMAQKLRLNRTYADAANNPSEIFDSIPQLYLFTPPGFNTLNIDTTNNNIRELRPRY